MALLPGTRIGPYEVGPSIGAGGAPAARPKRGAERAEVEQMGVGPHLQQIKDGPRAHAGDPRWA